MAKILVVDDDLVIRGIVQKILEVSGHSVHVAKNGAQASEILKNAQTESMDLVLTDIFMPDVNGLEFIRAIRQDMPTIKIVAMSGMDGSGQDTHLASAREYGAQAIISKPFDFNQLQDLINHTLEN